jgi:hypothetical protein
MASSEQEFGREAAKTVIASQTQPGMLHLDAFLSLT